MTEQPTKWRIGVCVDVLIEHEDPVKARTTAEGIVSNRLPMANAAGPVLGVEWISVEAADSRANDAARIAANSL